MPLPGHLRVTLGGTPLASLRAALADAGVRHNAYAEDLFPHVGIGPPTQISVRLTTIGALGLPDGATLDGLLAHVAPDLEACPLELGPRLALLGVDLPEGTRLTVVSRRVLPDEAAPRGFYLRRDAEGPWLRAFVASDDWVFAPDEGVVLCVRPKPAHDPRPGP